MEWIVKMPPEELSLIQIIDLQAAYPQHLVVREIRNQIQTYCDQQ